MVLPFFVIDTALHKSVSAKTSVRWVVKTSEKCGISRETFKVHLIFSATASPGLCKGLFLIQIAKVGGWTSFSTLAKFFDQSVNDINIGLNILNNVYNTLYSIL